MCSGNMLLLFQQRIYKIFVWVFCLIFSFLHFKDERTERGLGRKICKAIKKAGFFSGLSGKPSITFGDMLPRPYRGIVTVS